MTLLEFPYNEPRHRPNARAIQQHLFASLQSCKSFTHLTQIHAHLILHGLSHKNFLLSKLLAFCVASGHLLHAQRSFEQMDNPTTAVYNQLIRGLTALGSGTVHKPFGLYNQMRAKDVQPDCLTYSFLLTACARLALLREGEQLHGRVLSTGFTSNIFVQTNLINMYAAAGGEGGGMGSARFLFDEMPSRTVVTWNSMLAGYFRFGDLGSARALFDIMPERNVVSWTTMIAGCAQTGKCRQALSLFREMLRVHVEPNQVTMISAVSACAELGDLRLGQWIHAFVDKKFGRMRLTEPKGQKQLVSLDNALMHMYAKCGVVDKARKIFEEMPQRSNVSWTTMITGFAMNGFGEDAVRLFKQMEREEIIAPDKITFLGVLCACCHMGWVDEGREIFEYMTGVCGIKPAIEHYGCMVDLLSRAGLFGEALMLIDTMPMRPNDVVWGALLGGCRIHKNVELADVAAGHLTFTELEPHKAAGYLALLSNVYATATKWDDVVKVRETMIQMGVDKPCGRSWIEGNGRCA